MSLYICPDCARPMNLQEGPKGERYWCPSCGGEYEDALVHNKCNIKITEVPGSGTVSHYCTECKTVVEKSDLQWGYHTLVEPRY